MKITLADLRRMQASGLIKGFSKPEEKKAGGRKVSRHYAKRNKQKDWIAWNLLYWSNERCLGLEEEYVFHPSRKWRFDWCIPSVKIAIEYEGGIFEENSGHNTPKHYTKDTEKYNAAAGLGWRVLRFTALNYKNLITELNNAHGTPAIR